MNSAFAVTLENIILRIMRIECTFEIGPCNNEYNRWSVNYLINRHHKNIYLCKYESIV